MPRIPVPRHAEALEDLQSWLESQGATQHYARRRGSRWSVSKYRCEGDANRREILREPTATNGTVNRRSPNKGVGDV
jgi:hypothetical protein